MIRQQDTADGFFISDKKADTEVVLHSGMYIFETEILQAAIFYNKTD